MNPVHNVSVPFALPAPSLGKMEAAQGTQSFKDVLMSSIQEVNSMQQAADRAVEAISSGEEISPAEVLTAVQKADIAFRLLMQIRNKLVQAYQEVQNIRV
ncbi:MAG: flagellar hook-basal body complex protein FliE [Planctomycetes bacterium RBG_16_64_12]|nr:MAG: flagellar hook-basal body complex protein FliE [Planctomycetes bacterium RBG_16_64_12]